MTKLGWLLGVMEQYNTLLKKIHFQFLMKRTAFHTKLLIALKEVIMVLYGLERTRVLLNLIQSQKQGKNSIH